MTRSLATKITAKIAAQATRVRQHLAMTLNTRHLSGPARITLDPDEVALVCLLKDGAYYLDHMLAHHRNIGVQHFLFIDNGSTDATRDILAREADVTVIANPLPVREYECLLRARIARKVIRGGWFLFADSDELMRFPRGTGRQISEFTHYCNTHGFDAVIGQVIDFFSPHSLRETSEWDYARSVATFDHYSLEHIRAFDYHDSENVGFAWYLRDNTIANADIKFMFGGIRNEVFGENCCLTTHRLIRNAPHIELYSHAHCSGNIRCADFPFLLQHYKFAGNFWEREQAQLARGGNWDHGEDQKRMSILQGRDDYTITAEVPQVFEGCEALISQGFLACSDQFLAAFPPHADPARTT